MKTLAARRVTIVLIAGAGLSCMSFRHLAHHARAADIDSLYLFQPVAAVGEIADGNKGVFHAAYSKRCAELQRQIIHNNAAALKLAGDIVIADTALCGRVSKEIKGFMTAATHKHYFEQFEGHSVIDSVMDATGRRFALLSMTTGYIRTLANARQEDRKNALRSFAGFRYVLTATQSQIMILDAKNNVTYYYKEVNDADTNPLREEDQDSQLKALFYRFFFKGMNEVRS